MSISPIWTSSRYSGIRVDWLGMMNPRMSAAPNQRINLVLAMIMPYAAIEPMISISSSDSHGDEERVGEALHQGHGAEHRGVVVEEQLGWQSER